MPDRWERLPPVAGSVACLTCGCGAHETLDMDRSVCVGFGAAWYTKDGETLWSEGSEGWEETGWEEGVPTVADVEAIAAAEPDHDWRIHFDAPLYEAHYQRQGPGHWVLYAKGPGFA
jgi:hypothetical protein